MIKTLLEKYNQPTPRYTSYPPAPHWHSAEASALVSALQRSTAPLSVYVHIPFCEHLCLYCGCNVVISKNHAVATPYIESVIGEIDLMEAAHGRTVSQLHWGGGSPTYLDPDQMTSLFNAIVTRLAVPMPAEMSVEVDPRTTNSEQLKTLCFLGFNRLSVGIQDFDPKVQAIVHRIQPYEMTKAVFDEARSLGFESINADLIYGLPMQTVFSFAKTLDQVLELDPDRVAVFSYAHVPSLKRQQRSFEKHLPSEPDKLDLFMLAISRFTAAGYEHIGMDHFARPRDPLVLARDNRSLHRNFQGYTTHAETDLIGFGVSSISNVGKTFSQNYRGLSEYQQTVRAGGLPVFRGYEKTRDDEIRGTVIEEILCNGIVSKDAIGTRFQIDFDEYFRNELQRLHEMERDGLITGPDERDIRLTPAGRIFVRSVARAFDAFQTATIASKAV